MFGPYAHFCLDIETADGEPTEIERWARTEWSPDPRWKPATIGERYLAAMAKRNEKLALLEGAPIICVAIKTERDLRCLHCMRPQPMTTLGAGIVEGFASQRDMLVALRTIMEIGCNEETTLIGHNIRRFDLPKLRGACVRSGLRIPAPLACHQPHFDSMVEYAHWFRGDDEGVFISAADLMDRLGIQHHKYMISGGEVPEFYKQGKFDEIAVYAMLDVTKEYDLFLRMTGQIQADDPPPLNGHAIVHGEPADNPANGNGQSSLATTLKISIADELAARIDAVTSLGELARLFREVEQSKDKLPEGDHASLIARCEARESQIVGSPVKL